jgi:hypothetical protein
MCPLAGTCLFRRDLIGFAFSDIRSLPDRSSRAQRWPRRSLAHNRAASAHSRLVTTPRMPTAAELRAHVEPVPNAGAPMSSFIAVVRDARAITHRDLDTGAPRSPLRQDRAALWPGALLYLVLIDQVGVCFRCSGHRAAPRGTGDTFRTALRHFGVPGVVSSSDSQFALWALRCSFAHNYAATNSRSSPHPINHLFELTWSPQPADVAVVTLPSRRWDGDVSKVAPSTRVNLFRVEELGEHVVRRVRAAARRGDLEPLCDVEHLHRIYRFTITPSSSQVSSIWEPTPRLGPRSSVRTITVPMGGPAVSGAPGPSTP